MDISEISDIPWISDHPGLTGGLDDLQGGAMRSTLRPESLGTDASGCKRRAAAPIQGFHLKDPRKRPPAPEIRVGPSGMHPDLSTKKQLAAGTEGLPRVPSRRA